MRNFQKNPTYPSNENAELEVERPPVGLSVLWPMIQLGRSFRKMLDAHNNYFSISPLDLKEIYLKKAQHADHRGDRRATIFYMEKAVAIDPEDSESLYRLGRALEKSKILDEALETLKRVIELKPDCAKAHYHIGFIHLTKQEPKKAVGALKAALKLKPNSADIHFRIGQAFDKMQEFDKAIKFFNKATEIDPEHLSAYKHLALVFDSVGKHKDALSCLKRAMELEEISA